MMNGSIVKIYVKDGDIDMIVMDYVEWFCWVEVGSIGN